ncbi:MAG: RDD family protein [Pseudomonadota bacterium]
MQVNLEDVTYAGFWARFFASVLDSIIQLLVFVPLLYTFYGSEIFANPTFDSGPGGIIVQYVLPMLWVILFWKYKSATPGKIMMNISVVDATTGGDPTTSRLVMRYFGYLVSALPCLLGFFWVAWDKRKQGFHDMIANTVVINNPVKLREIEA